MKNKFGTYGVLAMMFVTIFCAQIVARAKILKSSKKQKEFLASARERASVEIKL